MNSSTGEINFDPNNSGTIQMSLSSNGLSLGTTTASANLHVQGNTVITDSFTLGTASSDSTFNLSGSLVGPEKGFKRLKNKNIPSKIEDNQYT